MTTRRNFLSLGVISSIGVLVTLSAVPLSTCVNWFREDSQNDQDQSDSSVVNLECVQLTPDVMLNGVAECESLATVDFSFSVRNRGKAAISGLRLVPTCSCQSISEVPQKLEPGESAILAFRVKAPWAGKIDRRMPVYCAEQAGAVLELDASLRVRLDPPSLLPEPRSFAVSFVRGGDQEREVLIESLEEAAAVPWIQGLEISPPTLLKVDAPLIDERPADDGTIVYRRYRFPISSAAADPGPRMGSVRFLTASEMPTIADRRSVTVELIDCVKIIPGSLRISDRGGDGLTSARVTVIRRDGADLSVKLRYDANLLEVSEPELKSRSVMVFTVTPKVAPALLVDTNIEFDFGTDGMRLLPVHSRIPETR